jgi:hypothetical protein
MVLVIVLIVVAALSLAAYSFGDLMFAHNAATQLSGRQVQAEFLAASGVDSIRAFLATDAATQTEAGGHYSNAQRFRGIPVVGQDDPAERGSFSILAPQLDEEGNPGGVRYGLENESARLNINALLTTEQQAKSLGQQDVARNLLLGLPGMTTEVADAILDWLDPDDEPREFGAEVDYYSGLSPPYAPKNGSLETVEDLLLVRGVTPQLLFGQDVNRNGLIDVAETASTSTSTSGSSDPASQAPQRGWASYLTLHSQERNVKSTGEQRIDLNNDNLQDLNGQLSAVFAADWVTFIIAYRQNGPATGNEPAEANASAGGELDLTQPSKVKFAQVLDLIGKKVQVKFKGAQKATVLQSPFAEDLASMNLYMPALMEQVTIVPKATIPGRININQAPREILLGIPGMRQEIVEQIVRLRQAEPDADHPQRKYETWLLTEGVVTLAEMKQLSPFICAGGDVYRAQVVGYFDNGGPSCRVEVVLDATIQPPRLLLWRDISHLGRGYALETLGVGLAEGQ